MNGENPYAPPATAETEAPSTRYWHTYGTSLIVRNGATLPKIDLDTGRTGEDMKSFPLVLQTTSARAYAAAIGMFAIYLGWKRINMISFPLTLLCITTMSVIANRLYGNNAGRITAWRFMETARFKAFVFRRYLRIGLMLAVFALTVGSLFIPILLDSARKGGFMNVWIYQIVPACALLVAGLGIWAFLDRPKYKLHAAEPGWMRIAPIHPQALELLHNIQAAEELQRTHAPQSRKRLVSTVYYWRYPLRMLIGRRIHNPLAIVQCALMKLLRSHLLVRETYHFSEAAEVPLDKLNPGLRDAVETWLSAHPDWTFITGEQLPSPAGDLTVETAVLASPGLEHVARITRAWTEQREETKGMVHFTFLTWLADGTHVSTLDQAFLNLSPSNPAYRATGTPEQIRQAHLRNVSTLPISPAADIAALRARLLREKEECDRLLTEKGFQSAIRESC